MGDGLLNFLIDGFAQSLIDAWDYFEFVLVNGGWLLLLLLLAAMNYQLWLNKKRNQYYRSIKWVFLNISVPDTPTPSILAADLVFSQIHATKKNFDKRETYILGQFRLWFSFEIVSLGGVIHYIIKTPEEFVETVKSALFAQYPDAEISEVGDYMEALPLPFNPDQVDYDLWGTELSLEKEEAYPVKTYPLFEHRTADTIIDPLSALLETMADIDPEEIIAIQIIAQPDDDFWKGAAYETVKQLKGVPPPGSKDQAPSLMQHLSDAEKNVINSIQGKLGKLSYKTQIRFLYAAPKGRIKNKIRVPAMMGAFAQFAASDLNSFKMNKFTATKVSVKISEKYEEKKISRELLWRKRAFITNFKNRAMFFGAKRFHLSTEELASLYHFPLEAVRKTPIEHVEARKAEPPINLPI